MIGITDRTLSRKFKAPSTLHGALRIILAANNVSMLANKGALTPQDIEAIAERFLYIEVGEAAADALELLSHETKEQWKNEGLAAHALWLKENRVVKPGKRFWVEGSIEKIYHILIASSDWNNLVADWLVRFAQNPSPIGKAVGPLVRIGGGRILVNTQAIIDTWQQAFPHSRREPEVAKIGTALKAMSAKGWVQLRHGQDRIRYRNIDLKFLFKWAGDHVGNRAAMRRHIGLPVLEEDSFSTADTVEDLNTIVTINDTEVPQ
jgi:hypothetical protein